MNAKGKLVSVGRAALRTTSELRSSARKRKRTWSDYRKFLRKEFRWKAPLSQRRPRWWRKGFLSRSVTLYQLEKNDPSLYINDVQRYTRTKRMVHSSLQEILDNKFAFFLLINQLGLNSDVVPMLGLYVRGSVHVFPNDDRVSLQNFLRTRLNIDEKVFVKPLRGAEGRRVRSIRRTPNGYRMNGQDVNVAEIRKWIEEEKRPMLFERGIEQHHAQAALNPAATNTLRILTMPDVTNGKRPFIAAAVQRIGTELSGHVDNWTQGGLSAKVDIDTGRLSRAGQLPDGRTPKWFTQHPDTGALIEGTQVPFWEETRALALEAANRLSFMEYVGWDIIISPTGPVILEGNVNSGMNVIQVHGPLLADPRVRAYYAKRGVIS
ncbi:sugar-transfer associated ATP-grasp domain-containing protein [Brevibacterium aurantiacum]|uniref:Sugar-transfer associated ATP-grasp n=1 Tax=Brevibacterium aurantiacum TaxID=273384 RepID=A0A2H1J264_BREAU|nr:sugar-transfer associated ATP-grasp domain-containing protein [Brevibacterium aurantiacum]SMX81530.1 Sugar-transfer associated ATP-grasp [Brevibacterium aurantiacum]